MLVKVILDEHLGTMNQDPKAKALIFKTILKEMPHLKESSLKRLYRECEHDWYMNLKRIPAEALLNKINETSEGLKERILLESRMDIVKQAEAINKINVTLSNVNKLTDVAPIVTINFHQEVAETELLNPKVQGEIIP